MEYTPELRPLIEWLEARERVEPCPAELLPAETRQHLEQFLGPADTYIAIPGTWLGPYSNPEKMYIYPRGFMQDAWIGLTRAELPEAFAAAPRTLGNPIFSYLSDLIPKLPARP